MIDADIFHGFFMFFASLSFWADVSGFLGLVIGAIGLVLTYWTYQNTDSIQKAVNEADTRHVLSVRSSDYMAELLGIAQKILALMKRKGNIQGDLTLILTDIKGVCKTIREKIEASKRSNELYGWPTESLENLDEYACKMLPSKKPDSPEESCDLNILLEYTNSFRTDLGHVLQDRKERI